MKKDIHYEVLLIEVGSPLSILGVFSDKTIAEQSAKSWEDRLQHATNAHITIVEKTTEELLQNNKPVLLLKE